MDSGALLKELLDRNEGYVLPGFARLTDAELRQRFGLSDEARGVVVTDVEPGGAAADRNIRPGDVIVEVGLEEVATPDDVLAKINKATETDRKSVLLLLDSSGEQRFVAVEIDSG